MKKMYKTPVAKKVEFSYQDQVVAQSIPIKGFYDPNFIDRCTWQSNPNCYFLYYTQARGMYDCKAEPS